MNNNIDNTPSVYGYIPSVIDGTEQVIEVDKKIEIPTSYSWKDVMPPVRNQGSTQTCVCQSVTCLLDFIKNCENDTPTVCNNFSIDTLYNMRSNKPQEGMSIKEAFQILKDKGLNGMKIKSFAKIPSVEAAKQAIMMFGGIVCGFPVYLDNEPYFWRKGRQFAGGHAVILIGWSDSKKSFILRNSWGKSWGNKGYEYIPYKEFEQSVYEAWTATI